MHKNIILIAIILITAFSVAYYFFSKPAPLESTKIKLNNQEYNIEIARSMTQKSIGLSNRESLCSNCGMIFIFGSDSTQPFWMKDTLIPLDMIWVNSQGTIVSIQTATPEPNVPVTQLKIYQNFNPAKYVIELNAGDSTKLGLKVGDHININL